MAAAECGKGRARFVLEVNPMSRPFPLLMYRPESTKIAYMRLVEVLDTLGPYVIEEKKTSLHVLTGRFAFLGVHPRPGGIRINLVLNRRLQGPRIHKSEQVSGTTFHNEVDVNIPQDFNAELVGWIKEAYALRAAPKLAPAVEATTPAPKKAQPKPKAATKPKAAAKPKTAKKGTAKKKSV